MVSEFYETNRTFNRVGGIKTAITMWVIHHTQYI